MPRHLIRHATSGALRVVGSGALPFFRDWIVLDTLDDGQPAFTYYDAAAADFRYVNVAELGDPASPAREVLDGIYGSAPTTDAAKENYVPSRLSDVSLKAAFVAQAAPPSGGDDTAALQAVIDALPAGGTLRLPAGRFRLSAPLSIGKPLTIIGAGCTELWGGNGYSLEVPQGPSWLVGSVLEITAAGIDGISISASVGLAVNLSGFGIVFKGAHAFLNTGHGVHVLPPGSTGARGNGLMGSRWDNLAVVGHDGNHYAFRAINGLYNTMSHLRGYGGGGLDYSCESTVGNYGNLGVLHPYFVVGVGGTAHGYRFVGTGSGWGKINLISLTRPQVNLTDFRTQFGVTATATAPDAPQGTFYQENVEYLSIIAPDFEAPGNNATHNLGSIASGKKRFIDTSGFFKNNYRFTAMSGAGPDGNEMTAQLVRSGFDGGVTINRLTNNGSGGPTPTTAGGPQADYQRGAISFGSGTAPAAGGQLTALYQYTVPGARSVTLTPGNSATAALGPWYASGSSTTGFNIGCDKVPAASQPVGTYVLHYTTAA